MLFTRVFVVFFFSIEIYSARRKKTNEIKQKQKKIVENDKIMTEVEFKKGIVIHCGLYGYGRYGMAKKKNKNKNEMKWNETSNE